MTGTRTEEAKRDRRHDEQIHRRDAVGMVMKKRPALRRWPRLSTIYLHHILGQLVWPISMPSLDVVRRDEVLLAEAAFSVEARGHWLRQIDSDAGLLTGNNS